MDPWTTKQVNMALIKKAAWRFMWTDKHKHPLLRCSCNQLSKHLPSSISLGSNLQSRHCDCWASSSVMATVKKELCGFVPASPPSHGCWDVFWRPYEWLETTWDYDAL